MDDRRPPPSTEGQDVPDDESDERRREASTSSGDGGSTRPSLPVGGQRQSVQRESQIQAPGTESMTNVEDSLSQALPEFKDQTRPEPAIIQARVEKEDSHQPRLLPDFKDQARPDPEGRTQAQVDKKTTAADEERRLPDFKDQTRPRSLLEAVAQKSPEPQDEPQKAANSHVPLLHLNSSAALAASRERQDEEVVHISPSFVQRLDDTPGSGSGNGGVPMTPQVELSGKRRLKYMLAFAVLVLSGVAVAVGLVLFGRVEEAPSPSTPEEGLLPTVPPTSFPSPFPSSFPTASPTRNNTRVDAIVDFFNSVTLSAVNFTYPLAGDLPEEQAVSWLIAEDPLQLFAGTTSDQLRLLQRYVLMTIWVQQTSSTPFLGDWGSGAHECDWQGVTCRTSDSGQQSVIHGLELVRESLDGKLSSDLGLLTSLIDLELSGNTFFGSLPEALGSLTNLEVFHAYGNAQLGGTLPDSYMHWINLRELELDETRVSGTLPDVYSAWTNLENFQVFDTRVSGSMPSSYGEWTKLQIFNVFDNPITGTLPETYGQWTDMDDFEIDDNLMTGTIPESLLNWTSVTNVIMYGNSFSGTMPFCSEAYNRAIPTLEAECSDIVCPCCTRCSPR